MSWQDEYRRAMTALVLRKGRLVVNDDSGYYGWIDYSAYNVRTCQLLLGHELVPVGEIREAVWQEFMGTLYEGDETKHGVEVDVRCTHCDEYDGRVVRYEATVGKMMTELLKEVTP